VAYLDRIAACNNAVMERYLPFYGRGARIGWIRADRAHALAAFPDVFVVGGRRIDLHAVLFDYDSATEAVDGAMRALAAEGIITAWRDERYAVARRFGGTPLLSVERAACPLLGARSWGFHLNGFVRRADGLHLWIAERAHDKPTYPGELDNTVAGGQPEGLTLAENVVKECDEEATIPAELAGRAIPVGAITYRHELEAGLKPDEMFCYDLELPEDFVPTPNDGEVHAFHLLPVAEVMALVRNTDRFKFNCALVLIDFFIRHGLLDPDTEPDYSEIRAGLNR
jgi:isopentenyldiphosphate isomerase